MAWTDRKGRLRKEAEASVAFATALLCAAGNMVLLRCATDAAANGMRSAVSTFIVGDLLLQTLR
ncbi:hypothetical protein IP69_19585 [Bosea sp. AAP35]|nr:hypothetical protein IP69_19585 [Bosea sp. AAP35]